MRIEDVEVVNLRFEYPAGERVPPTPAAGSPRASPRSSCPDATAARPASAPPTATPTSSARSSRATSAPISSARIPHDIDGIWDKLYGLTRWYGRKGAAMSAIGGIDIALWDLQAARPPGTPVWRLLGGDAGHGAGLRQRPVLARRRRRARARGGAAPASGLPPGEDAPRPQRGLRHRGLRGGASAASASDGRRACRRLASLRRRDRGALRRASSPRRASPGSRSRSRRRTSTAT